MKERTKAYMAGLMDAEGTFTITSCIHKSLGHMLYDPTVSCTSTYKPVLNWAVKHFGGTIYNHKLTETSKLPRYDWVTQAYEHSNSFILSIRPYVLQKTAQADILLEFYSLYRKQCPDKRQKLYEEICYQNSLIPVTTNMQDNLWKPNLINAYFAGFFDGESTVGYTNYGTTARIEIGNTNEGLLKTMKSLYGGNINPMGGESRNLDSRKPMWNWVLCDMKSVELFLLKMLPYIIIKREKSLEVLNLVRSKLKRESDLHSDMQAVMVT